jgi:hypothetical protein
MNDLGAWHAAQQTLDKYGKSAIDEWSRRICSCRIKYSR